MAPEPRHGMSYSCADMSAITKGLGALSSAHAMDNRNPALFSSVELQEDDASQSHEANDEWDGLESREHIKAQREVDVTSFCVDSLQKKQAATLLF